MAEDIDIAKQNTTVMSHILILKNTMNALEKKFRDYLKERRLSCTIARINVFRAVYSIHGHFCIDDVSLYLKNTDRYVSRATVYRMIKLLADGGFISEIAIHNGTAIYEWVFSKKPHAHLVCIACGKIVEVHKQTVNNLINEVILKNGFYPFNSRITIKGYCSNCKKKLNK